MPTPTAAELAVHRLTLRFISGLAFGSGILVRLWRYLAVQVGLPLEAPLQATRGWDIVSLRNGTGGLEPSHVAALALFCRWAPLMRVGVHQWLLEHLFVHSVLLLFA